MNANPKNRAIVVLGLGVFLILSSAGLSQIADPDQAGGPLGVPVGHLVPIAIVMGIAFVIGGIVMLMRQRKA